MMSNADIIAARHASVEIKADAWTRFDSDPFHGLHNANEFEAVVRVVDMQRVPAWGNEAVYRILPGAHVHIVGRGVILHEGREPVTLTAQWPA